MPKILITGSNGFVGKHLVNELLNHNYSVIGVDSISSINKDKNMYISADLSDPLSLKAIDFTTIDAVIHLAGLASVGPSYDEPNKYVAVNMGIQINLFEEALRQNVKPKFLIISSGSLYSSDQPMPLTESSIVDPTSPYVVSKIGQEELAKYYINRGFECIIARPFNHIGPGQNLGFLLPDLAKQIVDVEHGVSAVLEVGNLESKRDYTDVRDIVRAYRLLIEKAKSGETYNICSGQAVSGNVILSELIKFSKKPIKISVDQDKFRPSDSPLLFGDNTKMQNDTGWQPEIKLSQTLSDVLDDWRKRV